MARIAFSIVILSSLLFSGTAANAAIITYQFSGQIDQLIPTGVTPFGIPLSSTAGSKTVVIGQFSYDTAVVGTLNGTEKTYQEQIPGGFRATFDGHTVSADSYTVGINDRTGSSADVLSVIFSSFSGPTPTAPLVVDGTNYTVGRFSLAFNGPSTVFNTPELHTSLTAASFTVKSGMLTQVTGSPGGVFSITSLSLIPEPASVQLAILGTIALVQFFRRSTSGN